MSVADRSAADARTADQLLVKARRCVVRTVRAGCGGVPGAPPVSGSAVTALRVGLIVPSSNTVVEPELARVAGAVPDLELVATRVAVTHIDTNPASGRQFEPELMIAAARLLAHAGVDVLVWAGTSGCWLGVDHDRAIVSRSRTPPASPRRRRPSRCWMPATPWGRCGSSCSRRMCLRWWSRSRARWPPKASPFPVGGIWGSATTPPSGRSRYPRCSR